MVLCECKALFGVSGLGSKIEGSWDSVCRSAVLYAMLHLALMVVVHIPARGTCYLPQSWAICPGSHHGRGRVERLSDFRILALGTMAAESNF